MRTLVTAKQMKAIDTYMINTIEVPSVVLAEWAVMWVARVIEETAEKADAIWAVHDTGNNGADGVAVAGMLHLEGYKASLFVTGDSDRGTAEFLARFVIVRNLEMQMRPWQGVAGEDCAVLTDAVFGIGLSHPTEGEYKQCMEMLGTRHVAHTVAMDISSRTHGDTGQVMRTALKADVTVAFGWEKMGTTLYPGRAYVGTVRVYDTGFPESALDAVRDQGKGYRYGLTYESGDLCLIPDRPAYSSKGTFGRVLIAAGPKNICGATYLSVLAAYRIGAGLVRLLTVEENCQILQERLPETIIAAYASDQLIQGREGFRKMIEEQMNWVDVVVLGSGLGSEPYVEYLVEDILTGTLVPVTIDVDGLNAITGHPYLTAYFMENIIITLHLGEMVCLTGESIDTIEENLTGAALEYVGRYGITCMLRDVATVVAGRDGALCANSSGSSAMAKAGSGDVLTGVVVGLAAIGIEKEQAALMGVCLHGRAGEQVVGKIGQYSPLTLDLADCIGAVMKSVAHEQQEALKMKPYSKIYAAINLDVVTANMKTMRDNLPPSTAMTGVVKTDGYDHGTVPVARTIDPYVKGYAVTSIDEGIIPCRHGIWKMILILGITHGSHFEELVHYDIRPAIFRYEEVGKLSGTAVKMGKKVNIHLAVDMRMNRIGMKPNERSTDTAYRTSRLGGVCIGRMFTHFVRTNELDKTTYTAQYRAYMDFADMLLARDVTIPIRHCSNSAGIVESLEFDGLDMVWIGISICGLYPSDRVGGGAIKLIPTMELKSFITYIKTIEPGDQVSYGGILVAGRTMRVAIVPVGHGDGYLRGLSGRGSVLVRGQRARILGRVYTDQFMVDVTDIPDASEDDRVTLIGGDGRECISMEELAEVSSGLHYEIICGVGKHVSRVYSRDNRIIGKKNYSNDIHGGFGCM